MHSWLAAVRPATDNPLVDGHCRVAPSDELGVAEGNVRLLGRHATLDALLFLAPLSFGRARRGLGGHSGRHRIEARLAEVALGRAQLEVAGGKQLGFFVFLF